MASSTPSASSSTTTNHSPCLRCPSLSWRHRALSSTRAPSHAGRVPAGRNLAVQIRQNRVAETANAERACGHAPHRAGRNTKDSHMTTTHEATPVADATPEPKPKKAKKAKAPAAPEATPEPATEQSSPEPSEPPKTEQPEKRAKSKKAPKGPAPLMTLAELAEH